MSASGTVVERYVYDPYGQVTIWNEARTSTLAWADSKKNEILFCGYRYDPETSLYHVRHRMYHSTLGRWLQRDPLGYVEGMGLYEYVASSPTAATDPSGEILRVQSKNEANRRWIEGQLQKSDPRVRVDEHGNVSIAVTDKDKKERQPPDRGMIAGLVNSKHTHTIKTGSGRSKTEPSDPTGASDPKKGSGSTITLNPSDRTRLPRVQPDGSVAPGEATAQEMLEHEVGHAVHCDEGSRNTAKITYTDLQGTRRTATSEEVRTMGCSQGPVPGERANDVSTNDLVRDRNRQANKTNVDEGVFVGVGKEAQ